MENQPSMEGHFITMINKTIEDNIDNENFSVEDLAKKAGLSRSMLHRKLKKLINKSASDYIMETRLNYAMKLIQNEEATISEIAYKVGFNDPSYFNKVFKKHFNVTPGDVKKNLQNNLNYPIPEHQREHQAKVRLKGNRYSKLAAIILFFIIIVACSYYFIIIKNSSEKSVAVLPLDNLTGVSENNFIIDGLQDALIGELGQIKSIRVISRTSTLRYRDSDMLLPEIAKELGVNTIVEGSVHCLGDSICIIIQLIDVFPKERHLLASEYRDDMHNALKIQRTAVKDIAQNINIKLSDDQRQHLTESRKIDPENYKDYLRGIYHINLGTPESFYTGIEYMQKVIQRDPGEPLGHAGLALGYAQLGHGYLEAPDAFRTAEAAANKALKIDPYLDEAYTAIAMLNTYNFWNWPKANEAFENALARNPNNEITHAHYAWYHVLFNDKDKSLHHARMATVLEPLSPAYYSWYGWLACYFGEYELAEIEARKTLEMMEFHPFGNVVMGWVYLHKKQFQEAIETHKKLPLDYPFFKMVLAYTYVQAGEISKAEILRNEVEEIAKNQWVNPFERGMLAGMLGDMDKAFELINIACEHHYYPTNHINVCIPGAEFLKDDPRYYELFEKMNLPVKRDILAETK